MTQPPQRLPAPRVSRCLVLCVGAISALAVLAGCGSDTAGTASSGAAAAAPTDTAVAGDNGNGEATPSRFVSTRYHYRIDTPGTMVEAADGTASATRGIEHLTVRVVTGAGAADVPTFAAQDLATAQSQSPQYHLLTTLASTSLAGRQVQKVVYAWVNGSNPVTGNPQALVTARYYIPRDSTTLAVVTYSIAANQYDPQGADDVVMTFAWQ